MLCIGLTAGASVEDRQYESDEAEIEGTNDDWSNEPVEDEGDPIDRKDSGTALNNEINPFKLLPPQFHALLNIPIHDYGNGTTYNPYDKFLVPHKNKFPLVSTGYANTKYQGRPTPNQSQPSKTTTPRPTPRPTFKKHKTPSPYVDLSSTTQPPPPKYHKFKTSRPQYEGDIPELGDKHQASSPTTAPPSAPRPPIKFKTPRPYNKNGNRYPSIETHAPTTTVRPTRPKYRTPPQEFKAQVSDDDYDSDYEPPTYRPIATTTTTRPTEPKYRPPPKRPNFETQVNNDDSYEPPVYRPSYTTIRTTYDQSDFSVQVSPKPFKAVHQADPVGEVEEVDIIYDYEDDPSQEGEGILFMVDNGPTVSTTPAPAPVPSYPTIANRDPPSNPTFRPSQELDLRPQENFNPRPDLFSAGDFGFRPPYSAFEGPRPPFRFPIPERKNKPKNSSPPNILPLFRPNTNPTDEFQFIKHPQQIDYQRHSSHQDNLRGQKPPAKPPSDGINPLPSALQSPFSQISQKVASFFGRRSGSSARDSEIDLATQPAGDASSPQISLNTKSDRSGMAEDDSDLDEESFQDDSHTKSDRYGMAADESDEEVDADDDHPFILYNQAALQTPVSIKRSDSVESQPISPVREVMGIRADPGTSGKNPPAFYVFTQRELETGSKPYLVVGPQYGPPPSVEGAELVHAVAAKPITPDSQRRSDVPTDGGARPFSPNAIKFPLPSSDANGQTPTAGLKFPNSAIDRPRPSPPRKPFFPVEQIAPTAGSPQSISAQGIPPQSISSPGISLQNLPPQNFPPQNFPPQNFPPQKISPQNIPPQDIVPQGIAPTSPGTAPPRIPMNPQKDVISTLQSFHPILSKKPTKKPSSIKPTGPKAPPQRPIAEAVTRRPLPASTTTNYADSFSQFAPVKYSTIEQEDGKQIAVVHPSYVVTYKPGAPELIDLEAPFIANAESFLDTSAGDQQASKTFQKDSPRESSSTSDLAPDYHNGFLPIISDTDLTQ